jgi:hypothetical protein
MLPTDTLKYTTLSTLNTVLKLQTPNVTDKDKKDERLQKLVCCTPISTSMPYGFVNTFLHTGLKTHVLWTQPTVTAELVTSLLLRCCNFCKNLEGGNILIMRSEIFDSCPDRSCHMGKKVVCIFHHTITHPTLGLMQPACQLLHMRLASLMLGVIIMTFHCAEKEVVCQNTKE